MFQIHRTLKSWSSRNHSQIVFGNKSKTNKNLDSFNHVEFLSNFTATLTEDFLAAKDYIIPFLFLLCVIALLIYGPIPQDQGYHNFAYQRNVWGVSNFLNTVTNLPFFFVGLLGIRVFRKVKEKKRKVIGCTLFIGFILLMFGSGYYHLWPNNNTLVYDRLPMSFIFMSFFSFIIYGRIGSGKHTLLSLR